MKHIFTTILLLFSVQAFAEPIDSVLQNAEKKLKAGLELLRNPKNNNQQKAKYNQTFITELKKTFEIKGFFDYPFDRLTSVGTIESPDGVVRIFNWNVEQEDFTQKYFCFVVYRSPRSKEIEVTQFKANPYNSLNRRPQGIVTPEDWYGALYYDIIPIKKYGRTYYTLLGWDGNTLQSNMKVIDVLYFSGKRPKLGYRLFKKGDESKKRIFFEYKERALMSLKYDENRKIIIFDHLSPETPELKGFYSYYVPDLSYDAFEFSNNYWQFKPDIIAINKPDSKKIEVLTLDRKSGDVKKMEIKRKWIDPTDNNTGDGKHVARMPGDEEKTEGENNQKNEKKNNKYVHTKKRPESILNKRKKH